MTTTKIVMKIVIICAICAATMMSGCLEDNNLGTTPPAAVVKQTHVSIPIPVATAAPTPEAPEIGTYYNPIPLNKSLVTNEFEMGVLTFARGEEINNIIMNSMFNSEPKNGYEYIMVFIGFINTGTDRYTLSEYDFVAYANDVECDDAFIILPDRFEDTKLGTINIMPNGEVGGTKMFEVPIGEQVIICYDRLFGKSYYFDIGTDVIVIN